MRVPLLVAHRGYAHRYPENSLESLQAALEVGACFLEFDVQLTADKVPVLLHDSDLQRTAGVQDEITELSYAQLSQVEINQSQRFGDCFVGIRIPTLASAIALLRDWPRAQAFVEVKPESVECFGVDLVLDRVAHELGAEASRCVLISSVTKLIARARESIPLRVGQVLQEWSDAARRQMEDLRPDYLLCNVQRIPSEEKRLWPGPWQWVVYEVTTPTMALELAARGADLVETMAIGEMLTDPELGTRSCRD